MQPDLEVETEQLRRSAAAVIDTASRVTGTAAQAPLADSTPRWATADAATLAAATVRRRLEAIGADLADTARQLDAAAAEYETADSRAAARLRPAR